VNGESSVHIDRGYWLYRFALDTDSIAIYRSRRTGQDLATADCWRCLAVLGISDAFIVPVPGGWQPFIELGEGLQRWALEKRAYAEEAENTARHFLASMADAIAEASRSRGLLGDNEPEDKVLRAPLPPPAPSEEAVVEQAWADARSSREASGWELLYSRQRAVR
jgi:hypothetical protein